MKKIIGSSEFLVGLVELWDSLYGMQLGVALENSVSSINFSFRATQIPQVSSNPPPPSILGAELVKKARDLGISKKKCSLNPLAFSMGTLTPIWPAITRVETFFRISPFLSMEWEGASIHLYGWS